MKRVAIIQSTLGMVNRGSETFCIEIALSLSKYYEIEVYSMGIAPELKDFTIEVPYHTGKIENWYTQIYQKSEWLQWLSWRSKYTYFMHPDYIKNKKWTKHVYHKYLKGKKYDILFPNNGLAGAIYARKYRKVHRVPYLYVGAGGTGPCDWWVLQNKPDCYVAISSVQERWASKQCDRVVKIPNGTFVEDYVQAPKSKKFCINPENKLVLSVGALDMNTKRHQLAIEAVAKLSNVDLLILGQGQHQDKLQKLGDQLLPGRFAIRSVPHAQVASIYHSADIFTLPSREEPFGIVYIEAMASGLACVATDDETRREVIGNAGMFCDVENITEYANTIKQALEKNWGNRPVEQAMKFDYSVIGKRYYELIESIIG